MKRFANGRLEQHHHTRHHKHYLYWLGLLLCISFIVVIAACANLTEGTPSDDDLIDASTELDGQMMATFQQTLQQVTLADVAEAGVISLAQNHLDDWQTLTFSQSYVNPVVLMQPLSFKGGQPAMIRLRNVTATSAEFQIDEWEYLDGWHTQETVSYLVIEQGQHSLRGVEVEVGTVSADHQFFTHEFTSTFGTPPVVLSQVQTTNDGTAVVTRQQNVTEAGFAVRLQEQEAFDRGSERAHVPETVAYLAAEVGVGEGLELATQGGINHTWAALNFNNTYNAPIFLANLQTYAGGDTAGLRLRELASATGVEVKVEEEKSFDNEKNHAPEVVGWLVLEGAPTTSANMVVPQSQLLPAGTGALDFTVTTSQPATVKADLTDVPFGAMAYQGQASADGRSHQFSLPAQTDVPTTVTVRAVSQLTGEPLGEAAQINYRVVRDAPVTYPRLFTLWYPKFGNWADLTQEKLEALNVFIINLHGYGREDGYQPIDETLLRQARANNPELKLLTQFYSTYGCEGGETEFCDVLEAADADPMHPLFEQIYVRNADGSIWLYGPHPVYNFSNLDTVAFLLEQNLNLWHHDLLMFDGMFMDNCWRGFKGTNDGSGYDISTNIDLNLDGVADDPETRDRAFEHGLQDFLSGLRAAMPNALILCNSIGGRPDEQWLHNTGTPLSDRDGTAFNYADVIDGIEYEDALAGLSFYRDYYRSFAEVIGDYQAWNDQRDGVITMMPNKVVPDGSASDAAAYSDLRATRFGLAAALMGDGVFLHGGWGYYTWFDEYDVDLGAAVDDFGVPLPDNLVIWRREFEHGIALLNSSDDPVTVQLGDTFRALTGTQDPQVNNGELVTEMTLDGVDGRILLRTDEVIEPPSSVPPIIYLQSSISARPLDYTLLANINYVESLPFDGMVVNIPA
ncbi:MAG: putative glycoside hydrolase, partial [Deinococcota bacterium]